MVELRFLVRAINKANFTISDRVDALHSLFINYDKTVICAIRDHKQISRHVFLFLDTQDFARILKVLSFGIFYFLSLRNLFRFCNVGFGLLGL